MSRRLSEACTSLLRVRLVCERRRSDVQAGRRLQGNGADRLDAARPGRLAGRRTARSSARRKQPGGGWLVLNKSYQDVAVFSNVTCTGGCKAGVLLRAEKTPDGMKGIYVSLTEGDLLSYAVTLDAQGGRLGRTQLPIGGRGGGGGAVRGRAGAGAPAGAAPRRRQRRLRQPARRRPRRAATAAGAATGAGATRRAAAAAWRESSRVSRVRPAQFFAGQTNSVDITLAKNTVTVRFNGGSLGAAGGHAEDAPGKYGPIALYVGGTGVGELQGCRVRRSERASVRRREDVAQLPRAAAQRVLLLLLGGDRRHQPRRQPRRHFRPVLLPRSELHGRPPVLRRHHLQPDERMAARRRW